MNGTVIGTWMPMPESPALLTAQWPSRVESHISEFLGDDDWLWYLSKYHLWLHFFICKISFFLPQFSNEGRLLNFNFKTKDDCDEGALIKKGISLFWG